MTFRSLMADVQIAVNNQTQTQLVEVTVDGTIPTASVDFGVPAATVGTSRPRANSAYLRRPSRAIGRLSGLRRASCRPGAPTRRFWCRSGLR